MFILRQNPDGDWFAADTEGAQGADNVSGWDAVCELLDRGEVAWEAPAAMSRFRAQFGEPPQDDALSRMTVAPLAE